MNRILSIALCLAACLVSHPAFAADSLTPGDKALHAILGERAKTIQLWPGKPPDEPRPIGEEVVEPAVRKENSHLIRNVTRPTITLLAPERATGPTAAVLVCPGGGYGALSMETEGTDIVKWLNAQGITGIVLKYRVPKRHQGFPQYHHAVQDGQRALGLIRQHAKEWNIDPKQVGILGFSAGGHLAATVSNNHDKRLYTWVDAADDLSCKPDFTVLIYPAYLTSPIDSDTLDPVQHAENMSRATTPPTFIAVAQSDKFARGATGYFMALRQARVPGELHVYEGGGHGNGMKVEPLSEWAPTCARWLKSRVDSGAQ